MFTTMEFDTFSFVLGLALSGAAAGVLIWSEKCSLANRIAYSCCEQARLIASCKRELAISAKDVDRYDLEALSAIDENLYPIETEEFKIELLPSERVQTDVHISEYIGVYSKRHDLWLMIEDTTAFLEEGTSNSCQYYFCTQNFKDRQFIKTPHSFKVGKYLLREKS